MKTLTSTVGFQDEAGNLLGSLILNLPPGVYSVVSGGGQVAGQSLIINLDATGKVPGSITIWASDELSPQTPYAVTLCAQPNGAQAVGTANWFIGGSSPIDLSQMVPTAAGVSYSGAILANPTSQQTINGQTLNIEGAPLGFSATGSTTPDSFFSRISAGVIAVGTAIGNALGTIMANAIKPPTATSFSIFDPNGASHFFISGSAPYTNTFVNGNGSGVVFLGSAAKAAVSDTTGTVTTAGGVTLQTTAQTLPATIANDTAGGILLTNNAGGQIQLGNGGTLFLGSSVQKGQKLEFFGATSGTTDIQASPVAGATTLTLPAATDTLVGRNTTDILTSKAIGAGGLAGLTPNFQKFTSSGTFTIPTGITAVKATVVGGGGAGGGATTTANASGTGGFGGGAAIKWLSGLTPGNTLTVTVGAGGTGVANGAGNGGTSSTVASGTQTISTITGGGGGGGATTGNIVFFSGGSGSGGDLNLSGGSPTSMLVNYCNSGSVGGISIFSGGGAGGFTGAGVAGTNPGAGGGGAGGGAAGTVAGGAGANGLVLFEWMN